MKRLVITGATSGIGAHCASRALASGYEVIGLARRLPEKADFPIHQVDVADHAAVAGFFRSLRDKPLWGIVNAAGIASMNLAMTTPARTMADVVSINLLGTIYCCTEGAKVLLRAGTGRIVNFSTIAVALGLAGESVYAASKAGVEAFTRCFARELGQSGITANTVAPGPVPTRLLNGLREEQVDAVVRRQVIPRPASLEDVWNLVAFLLSEESAMLSGEILRPGGV